MNHSIKLLDHQTKDNMIHQIAQMHKKNLSVGVLSQMGEAFLFLVYKGFLSDSLCRLWISEKNEKISGFCLVTLDKKKSYRRFVLKNLMKILWFSLKKSHQTSIFLRLFDVFCKNILKKSSKNKISFLNGPQLLSISVDPQFFGKNIAQDLFVHAMEFFKKENKDKFFTIASKTQKRAQSFYKKMGGIPVEEISLGGLSSIVYQFNTSVSIDEKNDKNIPWFKPTLDESDVEVVTQAVRSGWISNGPYVSLLEEAICEKVQSRYALAVSNGTTALHLAYWALDLRPGDEVIVPGFTFVAPASIAQLLGARVVCADIDPKTWCIDPEDVLRKISPRTKIIAAVHTYGNVCNMEALRSIALKHHIHLIEDAAEALGSTFKGEYAGTLGTIGIFSLHATKHFTSGEGGIVVTDDPHLYEKMKIFREHGMKSRSYYWHDLSGHNFRLSNIHASLGFSQIQRFNQVKERKKEIFNFYDSFFKSVAHIQCQTFDDQIDPSFWVFALMIHFNHSIINKKALRNQIIEWLKEDGIEVRPGFVPISDLPAFKNIVPRQHHASRISESIIVLPSYLDIQESEMLRVCDKVLYFSSKVVHYEYEPSS